MDLGSTFLLIRLKFFKIAAQVRKEIFHLMSVKQKKKKEEYFLI